MVCHYYVYICIYNAYTPTYTQWTFFTWKHTLYAMLSWESNQTILYCGIQSHTSNSRVFKTLNFVAVFKHLLCFKYWLAVIVNTDCNMFYLDAQEDRDVYGLAKRDNSQIDIFSSLTGDSPKMQVKKKSSTIFLPYCLSTDPAILKKPNKVICINWFIKYGVRNPNNVTCTYFYQLFWYSLVF